jgi:shikimate kinase
VCLSGDPALLAKRIAKDGVEARPLFADAEDETAIAAKIAEMMKEREKLYAEADLRVKLLMDDDTGEEGEDLDGLCKRVLACLKRRIEEDDTKSRLKNEPKEGDITVSGM